MFDQMRELWNMFLPDNNILLLFRLMSGTSSLILALFLWYSFIIPPEIEQTWTKRDFYISRVIQFGQALGATIVFFYFFNAGLFELNRAGTPVKLILANTGFTVHYVFCCLSELNKRYLYWRKHYRYGVNNLVSQSRKEHR